MSLLLATMQYYPLKFRSKVVAFLVGISLILMMSSPKEAVKLPPNVTVPALIAFGDSLVDTGNNNYIKTIAKCNFPPYGRDFIGGIPTGRFSNGRILTDLFAEELSIKKYVPAYLDPNLAPKDLLAGVSFASGNSGYDPLTAETSAVIPLHKQLEYFKEYMEKLQQLVGEQKTQFILANSVFIVFAGTNDLAITYYDTSIRRKQYDIDSYTDLLVHLASSFIQDMYTLGARRIAVFSIPTVGCLPLQRTIGGGIVRNCAKIQNDAAQLFNSKLSREIDSLALMLQDSRVAYINLYDPTSQIQQNPRKYGFEQVAKGCCGTGLVEVSILCNKLDPICPNDSKYYYWDSVHLTEHGYQTLISLIINEFINRLFGI